MVIRFEVMFVAFQVNFGTVLLEEFMLKCRCLGESIKEVWADLMSESEEVLLYFDD